MNLRNQQIKKSYDSDEDDILNSFYIPSLSVSVEYQRLAGFFSSSVLAIAARGIAGLILNDGKMKLICGAKLTKSDTQAILKAHKKPNEIIEEFAIRDLESLEKLENEFILDHVKALGWMVANKLLEIRIGIVMDSKNEPLDYIEVIQSAIFHQKVGILQDAEGNKISFSGSDNESLSAWTSNIEEFKVFRSWEKTEEGYLQADCNRFFKFWNGLGKRTNIIDVPQAVKNKLIEIAPRDIKTLNLKRYTKAKKRKEIKLWSHQIEAVDMWLKNNKRCLFEMATATGKTFAALECLKKSTLEERKLVTIIVCPYNHLIHQWQEDLHEYGISIPTIISDSSNPNWRNQTADFIRDINNQIRKKLAIFTTYDTFHTQDFIEIIKLAKTKLFLIADEVHHIGAKETRKGLIEEYDFRLGLSATPSRWLDPEGTRELLEFFNAESDTNIFSFPLVKAIRTINPDTGLSYLAPYEYMPYFVELTEDELNEYLRETKKIAKSYHISKDKKEKEEKFNLLLEKRQKIIRNAANKYIGFQDILNDIYELKHCIIYCSPEQINTIQDILVRKDVIQHKFTMKEGKRPDKEFSGLSERDYILNKFTEGVYQALVAIRILDEGVDIPQTKIGIILASTGNPRQYIQRRGRLLRRFPGKEKALIYDIIVLPCLEKGIADELIELEKKILLKELIRYEEFANISLNSVECIKKIYEIKERCGIY